MNAIHQQVFKTLEDYGINYEVTEHDAAFTVEDIDNLNIDDNNEIAKNLFVRDDKKQHYYLIMLNKNKRANLQEIREKLGCRRLSFASEGDLANLTKLTKGSVSPFGILNDTDCRIEVVIDKDIMSAKRVGVHPNQNTATVWVAPKDLETVIKEHGNKLIYIEI